jgi:hypothetical protein
MQRSEIADVDRDMDMDMDMWDRRKTTPRSVG